ncbi:hypothetical protein Klosneuvirus_5_57 [Klosneuvirus KNV1]|uniref:Uncharacterized protein n=1 Tax=Klosneuvirus KNV1 TaxID=1977640 RepID=A0A1V0SKY2_9VIRU|nr:hypothetical protein Klosneuvirus_5_57 [Klosneuvirus KNV1]
MEEYNKLEKLINKYLYECIEDKIRIITNNPNDDLVKLIFKNYKAVISNEQKIKESCIVIIHLQQFDKKLIDYINKHLDNNVIFLAIVPLEFDFDQLIKSAKAHSIDAYYWRKDGRKYKNYIVTIKKD